MTDPSLSLVSVHNGEVGVSMVSWTGYQRRHDGNRVKLCERFIEDQMPVEY